MYTLSQAAKATGKSKSVISRAIDNGKLAASKDNTGVYQIDPESLFALYPEQAEPPEQNRENTRTEPEPRSTVPQNALQATIGELRERLEQAEEREAKLLHIVAGSQKTALLTDENAAERIAELKAERDAWKQNAEDWKTTASNTQVLLNQKQAGWLGRLFG